LQGEPAPPRDGDGAVGVAGVGEHRVVGADGEVDGDGPIAAAVSARANGKRESMNELPLDVVVRCRQGQLRGRAESGVATFRGIPYAAAPFGPNRFRPPASPVPWDGVRDALSFGPTATRGPYRSPFDQLLPERVISGEDILTLNVWTPDPGAGGLPVFVWIHGGAFENGSSAVPTYDGATFARDGVVCVSLNYRLGVDGFGYLSSEPGGANRGLLDQVAGLEWVRDNIAAFGGDPDNVTVGGESAGAMSTATLLSMPRARGLFRRAVLQSGAGHHVHSVATAIRVTGYLADLLGVAPTREGIAAVGADRLFEAQSALSLQASSVPDPARWGEIAANGMAFEPVVDGDVVPTVPILGIAAGAGADVEVLVGSNAEEMRLFLLPTGLMDAATAPYLDLAVAGYRLPPEAIGTYAAARPGASVGELLEAVVTDWFFAIPALRVAEARAGGPAPTYRYEFAWPSPAYDGRLRACHALEIGFVFDALADPSGQPLLGTEPPQALADTMHPAWVSFITTGDPGWPAYDLARRAVMRFDATSAVVDDPRTAERALWAGIR